MVDAATARTIPLKTKYLERKAAGNKSKNNNSGKAAHGKQGNGVRRKAYGPFNTF